MAFPLQKRLLKRWWWWVGSVLLLGGVGVPAGATPLGVSSLEIQFASAFSAVGGSIQLGGTASFGSGGEVLLPITSITSSRVEHDGAEIRFVQGSRLLALSEIAFVTSGSKTRLYADVFAKVGRKTRFESVQFPLTSPFTPRDDGSFALVFNEDGAWLFDATFEGVHFEKGHAFASLVEPSGPAVPEPGATALLGTALAAVSAAARRRRS